MGRGNYIQTINHHDIPRGVPGPADGIREEPAGRVMLIGWNSRRAVKIAQGKVRVRPHLWGNNLFRAIGLFVVSAYDLGARIVRQG